MLFLITCTFHCDFATSIVTNRVICLAFVVMADEDVASQRRETLAERSKRIMGRSIDGQIEAPPTQPEKTGRSKISHFSSSLVSRDEINLLVSSFSSIELKY